MGKGSGAPVVVKAPHAAKEPPPPAMVTAAFRANALPVRLPFIVMAVSARMLPRNVAPVLMVALLLTSHCAPQGLPPLITVTVEPTEAMSVLVILKTQTALGLPWASRVS